MGDVIPIRDGAESGPADAARAIGLAFQKATCQLGVRPSLLPRHLASVILLHRLVDSAAREMRNVGQLCDDACGYLPEVEIKDQGENQ